MARRQRKQPELLDGGCDGKRPWPFTVAERIARRMRRQQERRVSAYHCEICKNWHVGEALAPRVFGRRRSP